MIIRLYQKPRRCKDISHKIDFLDGDDRYNPFAHANMYAELELPDDGEVYNKAIEIAMEQDLLNDKDVPYAKSRMFADEVHKLLEEDIFNGKAEFRRTSKHFLQEAYAKVDIMTDFSHLSFFFELLGTSQRKVNHLTNVVFMLFNSQDIKHQQGDQTT